jgi:hypothetical protein
MQVKPKGKVSVASRPGFSVLSNGALVFAVIPILFT